MNRLGSLNLEVWLDSGESMHHHIDQFLSNEATHLCHSIFGWFGVSDSALPSVEVMPEQRLSQSIDCSGWLGVLVLFYLQVLTFWYPLNKIFDQETNLCFSYRGVFLSPQSDFFVHFLKKWHRVLKLSDPLRNIWDPYTPTHSGTFCSPKSAH